MSVAMEAAGDGKVQKRSVAAGVLRVGIGWVTEGKPALLRTVTYEREKIGMETTEQTW